MSRRRIILLGLSVVLCNQAPLLVIASGPMAATTGDSSCHTPEEESDLENNSFSYYDSVGLGTKVGRLVLEIRRRRWRSNGKKSGGNRDGASLQDGEGASVAAVDPTEHLPPTPTDSNVSFGRGTGVTGATAAVAEAQQNIESYRGKNQPSEFYAAGSAISRHSKPHATENSRPTGVTCAEDLLLSEVEANSREGWRVGEGIAVPADGADAIWDRLKVLFDGRRRAENGGGVATVEIGCGRTSHGHEKGCRDVLVMGNDVEGTCGRGRGGGCDTEETGTGAKASAVAALELHNRKEAVVEAVRWAWKVDSMDTLWLAGEKTSFARCVDWVSRSLDVGIDNDVNVFETTIRVLGGLLAAYHLSGEQALLVKAEDLGLRLAKAFSSPSGIPFSDVNLRSGHAFSPSTSPGSSLSEATTLQLEFSYLSQLTGDSFFHEAAQRASDAIETARQKLYWDGSKREGLAPVFVDPVTGYFGKGAGLAGGAAMSHRVTLGARGDSYYEYLLKQWLFSGKRENRYLERYQAAVRGVEANLVETSYPRGLSFVGEVHGGGLKPKMDHLVCFLPGTLALGHHEGAAGSAGDGHLELARDLMETCIQMYQTTATGLAPEIAHFNTNPSLEGDDDIIIKPLDAHNILRPETVESLYYLYWVTGNEGYRDHAWAIFQAFERHCRVDRGGYAGLEDVTDVQSKRLNKMETFFVAESLKYLLLIFSEENPMPFDRHVFNTEAHAFPIELGIAGALWGASAA